MKQGSDKADAVERLQLLDEQLKVIEGGARDVEGGLKNSNKVCIVSTKRHYFFDP